MKFRDGAPTTRVGSDWHEPQLSGGELWHLGAETVSHVTVYLALVTSSLQSEHRLDEPVHSSCPLVHSS